MVGREIDGLLSRPEIGTVLAMTAGGMQGAL